MKGNIARFLRKSVFLHYSLSCLLTIQSVLPRPDCSGILCSLRRITRDIAKSGTCFLKANVLSTPKIESALFHLKTSIREEWTTLRKYDLTSRTAFFAPLYHQKKQHKLWNEYIPLSQTLQLFWAENTEKT
jgi:hypothetical protein